MKADGDPSKDELQEDKRVKLENSMSDRKLRDDNKSSCPVSTTTEKPVVPQRCVQCRQLLDDPDLRMFPGDPCEAVSHNSCIIV